MFSRRELLDQLAVANAARARADECRRLIIADRVDAAWRRRAEAIISSGDPEAIAAYHADIARALGRAS